MTKLEAKAQEIATTIFVALVNASEYVFGVKSDVATLLEALTDLAPGSMKIRAWRIGPFIILKRRRKQ